MQTRKEMESQSSARCALEAQLTEVVKTAMGLTQAGFPI